MLSGKVITEEGLPLEGVRVRLNAVTETKTDISGRFFFTYIAYGKYNMIFEKEDFLTEEYNLDFKFKNRKTASVIKVKMLSTNYLVNEGFELLKEKKFKDAKDIIDKLEKINPDEDTFLYLKATYFYLNSDFSNAEALLEKLELRDRKNIYYQLTLYDVYEKLELFDKMADLAFYIGSNNPKDYFEYLKKAADIYKDKLKNEKDANKALSEYNKYSGKYGGKSQ